MTNATHGHRSIHTVRLVALPCPALKRLRFLICNFLAFFSHIFWSEPSEKSEKFLLGL